MALTPVASQIAALQNALDQITRQQAREEMVTFRPAAWQMLRCELGQEDQLERLCAQLDGPPDESYAPEIDEPIIYSVSRGEHLLYIDFALGTVSDAQHTPLGTVAELVAEWDDLRYGTGWRGACR